MNKVNLKRLNKNQRSFLIKVCFFIFLLVVVALLYLESKAIIDVVYFILILILFIRFLILKLYHV